MGIVQILQLFALKTRRFELSGGVVFFKVLSGLEVVENSQSLTGAYAGMILVQLGASVSRTTGTDDEVPPIVRAATDVGKVLLPSRQDALSAALGKAHVIVEDAGLRRGLSNLDDSRLSRAYAGTLKLRLESVEPEHQAMGAKWTSDAVCALSGVSVAIGRPSREPLAVPGDVTSHVTAVNGVTALLAALLLDPVDRPSAIRVSTAGCLEYFVGMNGKMYEGYSRRWMREGCRAAGSAGPYPAAIFSCLDGHLVMLARSREDWQAILSALGDPAWADRKGYRDPWRVAEGHADEVDGYVTAWLASKTRAEVVEIGQEYGFPVAPIRSMPEALDEEQLRERGFFMTVALGSSSVVLPTLPIRVVEPPHSNSRDECDYPRLASWQPGSRGPGSILSGLRVLDMSWVWSGPMVCMTLADLGADVIKIEHSRRLDGSRLRGRPSRDGRPVDGPAIEVTPYFHQVNHGKRSVELDITDPGDAALVRELALSADVLVENMRPGVLAKYGLGYPALAPENPGLVMLSMSLAGAQGPLRDAKGYAAVMSAMSGLESLIGYDADTTGMLSIAIGDPNAASHGLLAVLGALLRRKESNRGCWLDLSQLEALMFGLVGESLFAQLGAGALEEGSSHGPSLGPKGTFKCSGEDQWVVAEFGSEGAWTRFRHRAERFESHGSALAATRDRLSHEATTALVNWMREQSRDLAVDVLRAVGATASPVRSLEEVRATAGRRTLSIEHPYGGTEQIWIPPWWFDGELPGRSLRAPLFGEHTAEVVDSESPGTVKWSLSTS